MYLIDLISNLSIFAPIILGAIVLRKLNIAMKTLYVFIAISFVLEAIILYTSSYQINNLALFHLFTFLEFGFISAIYIRIITIKVIRYIAILISISFIVFSIYSLLYWEGLNQFNSNQTVFESVFVIGLVITYMFNALKALEIEKIETHPYYWLSVGFLLYFAINLMLFFAMRYVSNNYIDSFWSIHSIMNIILNLVFTLVLWLSRKI